MMIVVESEKIETPLITLSPNPGCPGAKGARVYLALNKCFSVDEYSHSGTPGYWHEGVGPSQVDLTVESSRRAQLRTGLQRPWHNNQTTI